MMPLTLANIGEENIIRKIGGKPEVKKHLENLAPRHPGLVGDYDPGDRGHGLLPVLIVC